MDVITDQYENISINQLYTKLSSKLAQLEKIDQAEAIEAVQKKDYIETSTFNKNYDEQDLSRVLEKFRKKDAEVRSHEQAHATIGFTTTPISYNYQKGPDGKMYAVGGRVKLDTSLPDDPKDVSFKLDLMKKAASAPADTSGADNMIAAQANLNKILLQSQGEDNASYE